MTPRRTTPEDTQGQGHKPRRRPAAATASPKNLVTTQRHAEAVQLRIRGFSYQQIADRMGWSDRSAAFKAVQAGREAVIREPSADLVNLEIDTLESLIAKTWTVIEEATLSGDGELLLKAIDRGAKLSESRRKLLGLDAPAKSDVTSGGEATQVVFHNALNPDTA